MPVPPPPPQNRVFCPTNPDTSGDAAIIQGCSSAIKHLPGVFPPVFTGRTVALGTIDPNATLYVICHGHREQPIFVVGQETWTPIAMANLLETSGLSKNHRQIVMLVCYAGQTLGNRVVIDERVGLQKNIDKVKNAPGTDMIAYEREKAFKKRYKELSAHKPTHFTNGQQVLPMVCQLMVELKARKYSYIRLRAFLGPVSTDFTNGIQLAGPKEDEPVTQAKTVNWL